MEWLGIEVWTNRILIGKEEEEAGHSNLENSISKSEEIVGAYCGTIRDWEKVAGISMLACV